MQANARGPRGSSRCQDGRKGTGASRVKPQKINVARLRDLRKVLRLMSCWKSDWVQSQMPPANRVGSAINPDTLPSFCATIAQLHTFTRRSTSDNPIRTYARGLLALVDARTPAAACKLSPTCNQWGLFQREGRSTWLLTQIPPGQQVPHLAPPFHPSSSPIHCFIPRRSSGHISSINLLTWASQSPTSRPHKTENCHRDASNRFQTTLKETQLPHSHSPSLNSPQALLRRTLHGVCRSVRQK